MDSWRTVSFSHKRFLLISVLLIATIPIGRKARSQRSSSSTPVDVEESGGEQRLIPPELIEYVEAEYPKEAFEQNIEAEVLARLKVDETGTVLAVDVVEPVGHGFDEAATDAMMRFRFRPAMRGDVPIAAQLIYRYKFFIKTEPVSDDASKLPAPCPRGSLSGNVLSMDDEKLSDANVVLTAVLDGANQVSRDEGEAVQDAPDNVPGAGSEKSALTDDQGRFHFDALGPGKYQIEVMAPGYDVYSNIEALEPGELREVTYRLERESEDILYETVVRGRRPSREVTRREITPREINKIPGTSGDALRSLHSQPGVARASFMEGNIIIRGSAQADSVFFFDSLNTPLLYHFGNNASVINSDLLEKIDMYPGNFSVRYGRATGGIVDATIRAPKTDRLHAYIDADFWDISALVESPIGKNWSVAASARRSYIDDILDAFSFSSEDSGVTVAPRYYDFQIVADYHPNTRDKLRMFVFGTDDRMVEIENAMKTTLDRDYHKFIYQAQLQWDHAFSDNWDNRFHLGFGYWGSRDDQETMREKWDVWPLLIRDELTWRRGDKFILRVGTDTEFRWWKTKMKEPEYYGVEDELWDPSSSNDEWIESEGKRFHAQPSGYTELELTAIPNTRVIYGMRVDYDSSNKKWGIDPRVAIRYSPYVTTTLKAGLGLFHQPPGMAEGDKDQGNPDLDLTSAIHYSVGVEQKIFENVAIDVEGFYKDLRHMITTSDAMIARDGTLVPERYDTVGIGRAYGMEAQIKHSSNRFFGWIAYTLMKSERRDEAGAGWRPFDYDQTHILTLLGSLHVGWGIDVGFRFQLVTGNPITPVVGFNYDVDSEMYYPIWGDDNSDRLPVFHQLDLRVDKKWQWKWLALTIYMDVRNVYNHRNEEGIYFNWGESEKIPIYSLPILPSAGVRLEY